MLGISNIVELLLITLLLITLVSLLWSFTSGTVNAITQSGTKRTERTQEILSACMIVESVYENKTFIKNCGDGVILNSSLNVFLDDVPLNFNMTPATIRKGEIGTIKANLSGVSVGNHDLKITSPSLQVVQRVEAISDGTIKLIMK